MAKLYFASNGILSNYSVFQEILVAVYFSVIFMDEIVD